MREQGAATTKSLGSSTAIIPLGSVICDVEFEPARASSTSDSLEVIAHEERISVGRDSILSIERAVPGAGHGHEGATIGLVSGAIAGWLIADAANKSVSD